MMRRELSRSHAFLALEEHRNRALPTLGLVSDSPEYDQRFNAAVTEYMEFLEEREVLPIREYMDNALRVRIGSYSSSDGLRPFFSEVSYRDPITMRTQVTTGLILLGWNTSHTQVQFVKYRCSITFLTDVLRG